MLIQLIRFFKSKKLCGIILVFTSKVVSPRMCMQPLKIVWVLLNLKFQYAFYSFLIQAVGLIHQQYWLCPQGGNRVLERLHSKPSEERSRF